MRIGFVEWPEGLKPAGIQWDDVRRHIETALPDFLITNEMPFGAWLASGPNFDADAAARSVDLHEIGADALKGLGLQTVVSSRPVWDGERLANEAFVINGGILKPVHHKHVFPAEDGWHEFTWFAAGRDGFAVHDVAGLRLGTLLCTELMFSEHARRYGKAKCELIAVPCASGVSHEKWIAAGMMAAIVSGAYVIMSNRVGCAACGPTFGGRGLAFAPDGTLIAETSLDRPLEVIDVDVDIARRQKAFYPCYIAGPE